MPLDSSAGGRAVLYDANGNALLYDLQAARVSLYGKFVAAGDTPVKLDGGGQLYTYIASSGGILTSRSSDASDIPNSRVCLENLALGYKWNGVSQWNAERNNVEGTLLVSAARVATTSSPDQTNYNAGGVRVRVNVTAKGAAPSITVAIEEKDSISGNYVPILTSAAITTVAQQTTLVVYPGVAALANVKLGDPLPRTWRVTVTHANGDSITYSVDYAYIR